MGAGFLRPRVLDVFGLLSECNQKMVLSRVLVMGTQAPGVLKMSILWNKTSHPCAQDRQLVRMLPLVSRTASCKDASTSFHLVLGLAPSYYLLVSCLPTCIKCNSFH
ncbi:hypothetical protein KP509_32G044100 [Ceratopteris richardii]|uniref:Uncharacterized protein n=1 Tax=Ceratopteris richardii TaxID=49495 RepID=A0A8T2QV64_CERRI|nr:hypothetical protein KP509_32G044100 [Ceratopteris richardii]